MNNFTQDELNLMSIYNASGTREGLLRELREMRGYLAADEAELRALTDSAVAKLYCGRSAFEVIDTALQVMGGIGYTNDCRISRLWRDQRVYRIGAGTDEIMIHIAGRAIQKLYKANK